MKNYQYYEGGTTFLLEIDHEQKLFSVGSFLGKPKKGTQFVEIDQTAYAEHIRKIDKSYRCLDNKVVPLAEKIAAAEAVSETSRSGPKTKTHDYERG